MRRVIFLGTLVLVLAVFFLVKKPLSVTTDIVVGPLTSPNSTPVNPEQIIDFETANQKIRAAWVKVSNPKKIFLYPNFEEKLSAQRLLEEKNCQTLISAGFYTKEGAPVGLFVSEGQKIKGKVTSRLFDGIFSIDSIGEAQITVQVPRERLRLALQSGPVLMKNDSVQKLQIKDDESARRIAVAISKEDEVYFLAIFKKDSLFEGPFLADLPDVIWDFEEKTGINFRDALNLDGGSASAFYSQFLTLSELSNIGSYFCLKS